MFPSFTSNFHVRRRANCGRINSNVEEPELRQILPAAAGPAGTLANPSRDLSIVACESDDRKSIHRSSVVV